MRFMYGPTIKEFMHMTQDQKHTVMRGWPASKQQALVNFIGSIVDKAKLDEVYQEEIWRTFSLIPVVAVSSIFDDGVMYQLVENLRESLERSIKSVSEDTTNDGVVNSKNTAYTGVTTKLEL